MALEVHKLYCAQPMALVTFLRDVEHMKVICKSLLEKGFTGLASSLQHMSLPNFAEWRWTTLADACKGISSIWSSLKAAFDPTPFRAQREQTRFSKVNVAE